MFYHFLLLKLICFEQLKSYKRVRFFWEFTFIFSYVRTDVKIWLRNICRFFVTIFVYSTSCSAYMFMSHTLFYICIVYMVTCKYICWFKPVSQLPVCVRGSNRNQLPKIRTLTHLSKLFKRHYKVTGLDLIDWLDWFGLVFSKVLLDSDPNIGFDWFYISFFAVYFVHLEFCKFCTFLLFYVESFKNFWSENK